MRKFTFQIKDMVMIDCCGIVGMVVNILIGPKDTKYLVSYQGPDGQPVEKYFYDIELSNTPLTKFGFGGNND